MQTINDRIGILIEELGITKTALANKLNVTQQYISKIVKTGSPGKLFIDSLCTKYEVNEEWLLSGMGEMFIQFTPDEEIFKYAGTLMGEKDELLKGFLLSYGKLSKENRDVIKKFAFEMLNNMSTNKEIND